MKQTASGDLLYDAGSSTPVLSDNLEGWGGWGWGGGLEGGDMCVPMADSCWCVAETNTILRSNHPPVKNKFINANVKAVEIVA